MGMVEGSVERGDFMKHEGVFGVLGVAEKRGVSTGRLPVEFRRAMRSPKEWSSPCEAVRIMSRYVSSVLACLLPCIFPKSEGFLRRMASAGRTFLDLRRAVRSGECLTPPCEGIMLTGLLVPKLGRFFFVKSQDLFQIADKEVETPASSTTCRLHVYGDVDCRGTVTTDASRGIEGHFGENSLPKLTTRNRKEPGKKPENTL